ncbi:MAG: flavin reductase family protein [Elusimicrobia bacterium]|jgi:flavin reductase (DIM6/NTAB) family NADH-FMN oxidoreductase RutF|nr:flavin reductase family protein [Elusimicrobiota bacterium]
MKDISLDKAYRLLNHGPLILVSTRSAGGDYDIAPIAWNCPVKKSPTTVLAAIGKSHKTYDNIKETGEFIVCVPSAGQADMVKDTGSVSGRNTDKFKEFGIKAGKGKNLDCLVPKGIVGAIECKFKEEYDEGVALVIGEAVRAYGSKEGFIKRVYPENREGRTLHHLGGGDFSADSRDVI